MGPGDRGALLAVTAAPDANQVQNPVLKGTQNHGSILHWQCQVKEGQHDPMTAERGNHLQLNLTFPCGKAESLLQDSALISASLLL